MKKTSFEQNPYFQTIYCLELCTRWFKISLFVPTTFPCSTFKIYLKRLKQIHTVFVCFGFNLWTHLWHRGVRCFPLYHWFHRISHLLQEFWIILDLFRWGNYFCRTTFALQARVHGNVQRNRKFFFMTSFLFTYLCDPFRHSGNKFLQLIMCVWFLFGPCTD